MSKTYESIKVETAVHKRLIYNKEIMQGMMDDLNLKSKATMSLIIDSALDELEELRRRQRANIHNEVKR